MYIESSADYLFPELFLPKNHSKIKAKDVKPTTDQIDPDNYFYRKKVCITGKLKDYYRYEVMLKIVNLGGIPVDRFTNDVDILIVGECKGLTVKMKRAVERRVEVIWYKKRNAFLILFDNF